MKSTQYELEPKLVAYTLATVSGILYAACAALIAIAPDATIDLFANLFHGIDITKIATTPTLGGTIIGFVEIIALALITGWLFAITYNYMLRKIC